MTFSYDDPGYANRRIDIDDLDAKIAALRDDQKSLAKEIARWASAVPYLEPDEVDDHIAEIKPLLDELKKWGLRLNDAESERREYGV